MMDTIIYREAESRDVPALACIRAADWGTEEYWRTRIPAYMNGELHPQQALASRAIYVACDGDSVVGFIAGHLTRRFSCDGELEWIDVIRERRRRGIASQLLCLLAAWFVEQKASRICVDVDPANADAQSFYRCHGAEELRPHWLVWPNIKAVVHPRTQAGRDAGVGTV
ncbi:MAG TPA: GNAT family N-acetyltransferase [Candidatus Acidoferrales bacterium]|nr:GNAT family N-acetyltransferase [Candidatus Acidoferrales bacterium]